MSKTDHRSMASRNVLLLLLLALASSQAIATDPNMLQDFCVADNTSNIFVNGFVCKNPNLVTADDFFFTGLTQPGDTANLMGSRVTPAFVTQFPGVNTLGIAMARVDFAAYGLNPPHMHPRASEVFVVLKGRLSVGFITSNPDNKLFAKVLRAGDVYVFPQGLVHFQLNTRKKKAVGLAALSSQSPGIIRLATTVFGSKPPITPCVLEKAFQLDEKTIQMLQTKFSLI